MQGSVTSKTSAPSNASTIGALANSSSPAPGAGRAMRGAVHGYDARTDMGKIKGDDGATYTFFTPGVLGGVILRPGQTVAFTDNDGVATNISVVEKSSGSSVGGLANSSSPAPGPGRVMHGVVHGFDARTGMGKIKGEDGASYSYFAAGVIGGRSVKAGNKVTFIDNDGVATKIALVRGRLSRLLFG